MDRIFITGARGFVGSHLPPSLALEGDLRDYESVKKQIAEAKPGGVIHLAAQSNVGYAIKNPRETYEVNFLGTFNLLEALKATGFKGRFLYVSSAQVYGSATAPLKESDPTNPLTPYAVSKAAAEMLCLRETAFDVIIARPFNHIGPGQSLQCAIPSFVKQLKESDRLRVGNLESVRDFCDVRDIVRGYRLLLEKGRRGEIYNLCSGREYRLREIVDHLITLSGRAVVLESDPALLRAGEPERLFGSYEKIYNHVGWQPAIQLATSLKDIWEHS